MRDEKQLLFDFIETLEEDGEVGALSKEIYDTIASMVADKEAITVKLLLKLENDLMKYENQVKEKYFNYGLKASEVI